MRLQDKSAVITGAAGGIGRAGIFVMGDILDSGFSYGGAFVNSQQSDSTRSFDDDADGDPDAEGLNSYAYYGRLRYTHAIGDNTSFMIGGDAGHQAETPPSTGMTNTLTGKAVSSTAYTFYSQFNYDKKFELLGSFSSGRWNNAAGTAAAPVDAKIDGYFAQASYRFKSFEPVIRYSRVEGNDSANRAAAPCWT